MIAENHAYPYNRYRRNRSNDRSRWIRRHDTNLTAAAAIGVEELLADEM